MSTTQSRRYTAAQIDHELPYLSFLIRNEERMDGVTLPGVVGRLVYARPDKSYPDGSVTPGGRLVYHFFSSRTSNGYPVGRRSLLLVAGVRRYDRVIAPGDPGYELMEAFKIACDHRVDKPVSTKLLMDALDLADGKR